MVSRYLINVESGAYKQKLNGMQYTVDMYSYEVQIWKSLKKQQLEF